MGAIKQITGGSDENSNESNALVDKIIGGGNKLSDTIRDTASDNLDAAGEAVVKTVETNLDKAKVVADELAEKYGEENAWNAVIEALAGGVTEGAIWIAENYGKQVVDALILYGLWSKRVSNILPPKVRIPLQITSLFALVGGSITEAVVNKLADKGYVDVEVAQAINEKGIEPLEKLNARSILSGIFLGRKDQPEVDDILSEYYNDPDRGNFQKTIGWLYGYNPNPLIAQ